MVRYAATFNKQRAVGCYILTTMQKTDESIRRICIAAIKRHTFKPIDYPLTTIFETELLSDVNREVLSSFEYSDEELPIALTHVDVDNWTLLTSRQIISNVKTHVRQTHARNVVEWRWNDIKGYRDKTITVGQLTLSDSSVLEILIETGYASMIMVYGIMTLTRQETLSNEQIEKTLSRYGKRGFFKNSN